MTQSDNFEVAATSAKPEVASFEDHENRLVDRFHHGVIDIVPDHVLYEAAVKFQVVNWQVLQIAERAQANAKIIQRKSTPHFAKPEQSNSSCGSCHQQSCLVVRGGRRLMEGEQIITTRRARDNNTRNAHAQNITK